MVTQSTVGLEVVDQRVLRSNRGITDGYSQDRTYISLPTFRNSHRVRNPSWLYYPYSEIPDARSPEGLTILKASLT